ncbi:flavin-dependent oxidoreductase, MSMEG_0569 family [Spongiibacter sp. IMCC21906]|jgi:putative flavoprotein involved in K+ transport|uniref:MSMEG_0569 family flavin-dependent oxidoreductase n=1 Tax=Spongiibacter sp. IMCC21906 TaxID=1620392 RepID=UPI00062DDFE2|nr:MSMEG_0569 family flavin-dependent oxidoreductase [Spongiibacter sp. IMCC21906]AKH68935.1 flavin-dependent oxidoreductase, MSMEG_0569 family [Spongiibacter sp. IMCC21906]
MNTLTEHYSCIIIGAGQAGLSMSYCLSQQGIDHILLERNDRVASNWRNERWDSFCLVTPNWQCQLPGMHYAGNDPDGFMVKDQIIDYVESYYRFSQAPVRFNSPVTSATKENGRFKVACGGQHYSAEHLVVATGGYHHPNILPAAKGMPDKVAHIHSRDYRNPQQLPDGEVMVVGTGQSGCQIAEDLHLAGRQVHLCVGNAPRVNRRYRGKDVVNWLEEMSYYETTIDEHPEGKNAPHATNHYVTGRDGGRDINLRIFAQQGMKLYGRIRSSEAGTLRFDRDLLDNLDYADSVAKRITNGIESYIQENGIAAPPDDNIHSDYQPPMMEQLNMNNSNISAVVWATGFKSDYNCLRMDALDEKGAPLQQRGVSPIEGLYFLGLNWMNTWGSGRFFHVGRDAAFLAGVITNRHLRRKSA